MWKIFFTYGDKSKLTLSHKGNITPDQALKYYIRYGLVADRAVFQQYPKKDHQEMTLEEKLKEIWDDSVGVTYEAFMQQLSRETFQKATDELKKRITEGRKSNETRCNKDI